MKRGYLLAALALAGLAACAAGANGAARTVGARGAVAGFWLGVWHGLICPVTFIVSLFSSHVGIYEIHNSGHWYDFGFLVGASIVFHGTSSAGSHARRAGTKR